MDNSSAVKESRRDRVEIFFRSVLCSEKKYYPFLDGAEKLTRKMEGGAFGAFPNAPLLTLFLFSFASE
jgi:hypothetical protein